MLLGDTEARLGEILGIERPKVRAVARRLQDEHLLCRAGPRSMQKGRAKGVRVHAHDIARLFLGLVAGDHPTDAAEKVRALAVLPARILSSDAFDLKTGVTLPGGSRQPIEDVQWPPGVAALLAPALRSVVEGIAFAFTTYENVNVCVVPLIATPLVTIQVTTGPVEIEGVSVCSRDTLWYGGTNQPAYTEAIRRRSVQLYVPETLCRQIGGILAEAAEPERRIVPREVSSPAQPAAAPACAPLAGETVPAAPSRRAEAPMQTGESGEADA
jgi:hypothetical protein